MKNFLIFLFLALCCALEASPSKYNAVYNGYFTQKGTVISWYPESPVKCSVIRGDEFLIIKKDSKSQVFVITKQLPTEFFLGITLKYEAYDSCGRKVILEVGIENDTFLSLFVKYDNISYCYKLNL